MKAIILLLSFIILENTAYSHPYRYMVIPINNSWMQADKILMSYILPFVYLNDSKQILEQTNINRNNESSEDQLVTKKILTPLGNQPYDKIYNVNTNTWSAEKIEQCEQAWLYSGGLFKSTGSCTFIEMNNYLINHTANCMVVDGDNIYIGTDHGIYFSNDYGETWLDPQIDPIDNLSNCKIYALSRGTNKLFACTDDGLYILTDGEISWDQFFDNKIFTCIEFGAGNDIFIGEIYDGIYKSTNYGSSWTGTPILNVATYCLKFDNGILYAGTAEGQGLKKSTNSGGIWIPLWSGDKVISIHLYDSDIYIGTEKSGCLISTDGETFDAINYNFPKISENPLMYYQLNSLIEYEGYLYAATECGLYKTQLPDESWIACNVRDEYFLRDVEKSTKMIYVDENTEDMWVATWGDPLWESAKMIEDGVPPFDPPNFPNYLCHTFTWHLTEDGISSVFLDGPNTMNYIPTDEKTDWEKQNWDYIQATWDDPLWEKVTYNWGHSGIKSLKNDVNETVEENLIIESKWGNNGPLVEHKLMDCPYYGDGAIIRYWKNKKVVSGEIVDDRRIGRELMTLESSDEITTTVPEDANVEFYVAPMRDHKINLKSGFHAVSGSNFHAYIKDYYEEDEIVKPCKIPWEENPVFNYVQFSNLNKNESKSHNIELGPYYSSNDINQVNRYLIPCDTPKTDPFNYSGLGTGTEVDPFQITNIEQFQEMAMDNYEHHWVLMNDIDASVTRYWNPEVVKGDTLYFGIKTIPSKIKSLDGKGHIIRNLYKYSSALTSLFSGLNCKIIKRVGFENFTRVGATNPIFFANTKDENYLVEECFVTGNIIGKFDDGKLPIGFSLSYGSGKIRNCYSDLKITAESMVCNFGKIFFDKTVFENCYAVGNAVSPKVISPFGYSGKAIACLWDNETIKVTDSLGIGIGLPTSAMMKRATFEAAGWDFDSTWYIDEGMDYPKLQVFRHDTTSVVNSRKSFAFSLDCNPNPAENVVNLDFSISKPCPVLISISNSLGMKIVEVMGQKYHSEGTYRETFDASALPSGVYFCTLQTPERTITKQFVVVK